MLETELQKELQKIEFLLEAILRILNENSDDYGFVSNDFGNFTVLNVDENTSTTTYVGKTDNYGNWVIQKIIADPNIAVTYASAVNNPTYTTYSSAWASRTSLSYDSYDEVV